MFINHWCLLFKYIINGLSNFLVYLFLYIFPYHTFIKQYQIAFCFCFCFFFAMLMREFDEKYWTEVNANNLSF